MRISDWSSDVCSSDLVAQQQRVDCIDKVRQVAFGFGHRQAAGRQRHAGQGTLSQRAGTAIAIEPVPGDQRVDARAQAGGEVGDDQVLVRGHAEDRVAVPEIGRATSELQSLMRISYAVFCLKKKTKEQTQQTTNMHEI